ncbi:hypothetical protein [Halomonas sp. G11]|uniref:hypothetical protein n=1 Tax=Halomonas sp. G11 TaxID=1684425 RepID=UPI0007FCBB70|nr:hypothetical protein [Halomonas sp. G11]OAZ98370.1 hypothetical protein ADS46_15955 [Halomonas sp. G11]
MEFSSAFRAKPIDRLVQPIGGIIIIAYSLMMTALSMEMRFFLVAVGAVAIAFGILYHFHKVFKVYEDHFEFKKTPISPSLKIYYSSVESFEKVGGSKLKVLYMHSGEIKRRTLYIGMLSKDDRDKLIEQLTARTPVLPSKG